jgi:N utilization substance protein B
MLYQVEVGKQTLAQAAGPFLEGEKGLPEVKDFSRLLAFGVTEHLAEIDEKLAKHSTNWEVKRFPSVDRALLRLGCFELLYCPDIPYEVTLNEYVELAREFGGDESPAFVNGLLDEVRKANPREKKDPENSRSPHADL